MSGAHNFRTPIHNLTTALPLGGRHSTGRCSPPGSNYHDAVASSERSKRGCFSATRVSVQGFISCRVSVHAGHMPAVATDPKDGASSG